MFTSWQRNVARYSIIAVLFYASCANATRNNQPRTSHLARLYTFVKNNADTVAFSTLFVCGSAAVLERVQNESCAANVEDCQMAPILFIVYTATGALTVMNASNR